MVTGWHFVLDNKFIFSDHLYVSQSYDGVFIVLNSRGSTDSYIEVLDGSRVHPETYEWARKMAVDALEYDESAEDANPAGALEEILENPERLKDLDLDAFAEELERQVGVFVCCNIRISYFILANKKMPQKD